MTWSRSASRSSGEVDRRRRSMLAGIKKEQDEQDKSGVGRHRDYLMSLIFVACKLR